MSGSIGSIARIGVQLAATAYFGPVGGLVAGVGMSLLFPEKMPGVSGPRLGPDQPMTAASIGVGIPIVFGTIDVNGIVIQDLGRVDIKNTEEQGGKGGPTQEVTTWSYTRTYAVLLADCSGNRPIDGVLRIWRNAKLVYDIRAKQDGESNSDYQVRVAASTGFMSKCALYLGTADQLPDPVLEAAIGVGLQPAYRHRAYFVPYDEDVTDNGGRTSQWKFELVASGSFSSTVRTEWSAPILYPWLESADPRNPKNLHRYGFGSDFFATLAEAVADAEAGDDDGRTYDDTIVGWSHNFAGPSEVYPYDPLQISDYEDRTALVVHVNEDFGSIDPGLRFGDLGVTSGTVYDRMFAAGIPAAEFFWWSGKSGASNFTPGSGNYGGRVYITEQAAGYPDPALWRSNAICSSGGCPYYSGTNLAARWYYDKHIQISRFPGSPDNPCEGYPALPENPAFCVLDGGALENDVPWSRVEQTNGFKLLLPYVLENDPLTPNDSVTIGAYDAPLGPLRPVGHADDTQTFWEAQEALAVSNGMAPPGRTYNPSGASYTNRLTQFPVLTSIGYKRDLASAVGYSTPPTLASVVTELCRRCRVSSDRIDVSDLDETIPGYRVDRAGTTGRTAIDPLRQYGYFDCVDSERVTFPTRGKAIVATLDEDTLGAHEAGQQAPEMVAPNRVEDVELPRKVLVRYPMPHADYNNGAQESPRQVTRGVSTAEVAVPIAMSDDKAKQMSEVLLSEAWIGRETYKLAISPRWLALEAADAIEIPIGSEAQRAVLTSITGGFPGVLQAEAKRDDQSIYLSTAAGVASGIRPQELGIAGLTVFALIDGPAFDEEQDEAGFYVGAYGTGTRWRGASLYESLDGGGSFSRVLSVSGPSTMGTIESALPAGPYQIWDEANTLTVTLGAGTLESRTEAAVLAGANAAFVGGPGRWELIQFLTATLVGPRQYQLSGLIRGRRGTEWAIGQSQAGDTFVLCSTLSRAPKGTAAIGQTRTYKMVTSRTLIEAAEAETLTIGAVALECYAPAHVTASRNGDGDITIHVVRRARLGPEWIDYADVPLNEDSERYSVDVMDGDTVVRVLDGTAPDIVYLAADQTADFGSLQGSVDVVAYQLSATVGRGYPTEATV